MKTAQEIAIHAFPGESLTDRANAEGLRLEIEKHATRAVLSDREAIKSLSKNYEGVSSISPHQINHLPLPFEI